MEQQRIKTQEHEDIFREGGTCPICEEGILSLIHKDIDFTYKGHTLHIQRQVFTCSSCEESFFQAKDEREIEKLLTDRRRRVDGLLTSDEIRGIRTKFGMTQVNFARYLRVSQKTFARYESGQVTQSYAMDNLLRVLQHYPEAMHLFTQQGTAEAQPAEHVKQEEDMLLRA
ncbi:type II toxin-antitoxin system MqsA family antitoxin [Desulfobacterales bacterium HSG16]|nr:type II toxin-antitoxin system MqsA family antitoxin [Desulfobacterales bacterium HSG16]